MDAPQGVVALPANDKDMVPCGGSAVLIGNDGLALTLAEALPGAHPGEDAVKDQVQSVSVILGGGQSRAAEVVRRGRATTAVLLRIHDLPPALCHPLELADSAKLRVGDSAWTAGNSFGALEQDGVAAISRGVVSGIYDLPADSPPVRGRGGRILSDYRGPVLETDAAVNDGNQGGALLDGAGRLIGLVSLGTARERRLGTAVPIRAVLADLGLELPLHAPEARSDDAASALARAGATVARGVALVYFERPGGVGNPEAFPRPSRLPAEAPPYERERVQNWWDQYYHQQQMFYTDQPVSALVIDAQAGLLLTAYSNLHGDAEQGRVLVPGGEAIAVRVVASHLPLDLALLRADRPLPFPEVVLASSPQLVIGAPIGVVARHRADAGYTFTSGVVSATARRRRQNTTIFSQTDAHVNYGSLGGAVLDAGGQVVGMVVMLGPDDERLPWAINSGVALFADSAAVLRVLPGLIQGNSTRSAPIVGLGVVIDAPQDGHLRVKAVEQGTGAEAAGVEPGDQLIAIDGKEITALTAIARTVLRHREGDRITLVVRRAGMELTLEVELRAFQEP
jgi:serine protease Do